MTKALDDYLGRLVPAQPDRSLVSQRRARIEQALRGSNMTVRSVFETGSHSHGTGIVKKSDVDYMIWMDPRHRTVWPSSTLAKVKNALMSAPLDLRYDIRRVAISSPTVQVTYGSAPQFEIVPGFLADDAGDGYVYDIPGRSDEWVRSSPESHKRYVSDVNDRSNKKVKPLIRLVKAWKYHQGVPVSSFYLEMRTAKYMAGQTRVVYEWDLPGVLKSILRADAADMQDPTGKVGRIPACSSAANAATTRRLLGEAVVALEEARGHATAGRWVDYWFAMRRVYPDFPYADRLAR